MCAQRQYEQKQHKRALKTADTILKKVPNHGETLALRGLTLNALDRKEEAYDHVRRGLRADLRNHTCWHVFGLLYRSDRNYSEAIKCYLNALKWDADNQQILRDLSFLQLQMRDFDGFIETRRRLLAAKSNNKMNWMAYAVGNLLGGRADTAADVVTAYLKTVTEDLDPAARSYEGSELHLFRIQALAEGGKCEEGLAALDASASKIVDALTAGATRGTLLLRLARFDEARAAFDALLARNADNYEYHRGLQAAILRLEGERLDVALSLSKTQLPSSDMTLSAEESATLCAAYAELEARLGGSKAPARIALGMLEGDALVARLRTYVAAMLRKGMPSLGSDLRTLVRVAHPRDPHRRVIARDAHDVGRHETFLTICALVDECVESLSAAPSRFPAWAPQGEAEEEPPSTVLFARFLRAQLLEAALRLDEALAEIDACIAHTPTMVELYQRRARLLKKSGDLDLAADVAEEARVLELSDRFVNNKATKYMLRCGRVAEAESTIALFARHEGDAQHYLYEMQSSWYELEWAEAKLRAGELGPALKKFRAVDKHYEDFVEDQFDFHSYCLRKVTLRAYVDLVRMTDKLHGHHAFRRAAKGIITCYLKIHDDPSLSKAPGAEAASAPAPAAAAAEAGGADKKAEAPGGGRRAGLRVHDARAAEAREGEGAQGEEAGGGAGEQEEGRGGKERSGGLRRGRGALQEAAGRRPERRQAARAGRAGGGRQVREAARAARRRRDGDAGALLRGGRAPRQVAAGHLRGEPRGGHRPRQPRRLRHRRGPRAPRRQRPGAAAPARGGVLRDGQGRVARARARRGLSAGLRGRLRRRRLRRARLAGHARGGGQGDGEGDGRRRQGGGREGGARRGDGGARGERQGLQGRPGRHGGARRGRRGALQGTGETPLPDGDLLISRAAAVFSLILSAALSSSLRSPLSSRAGGGRGVAARRPARRGPRPIVNNKSAVA